MAIVDITVFYDLKCFKKESLAMYPYHAQQKNMGKYTGKKNIGRKETTTNPNYSLCNKTIKF
jgi:hypothetical protein